MKNNNSFNCSLVLFLSVTDNYDYTMEYMENVARNFTKKYPNYLIHKKSEDKIKAFMTDIVKEKVEKFANAEAKVVNVTDIREIADLVAIYESVEGADSGTQPTGSPSMGAAGLDLAMGVDTGAGDIHPVATTPPKTPGSSKPKIMKRSIIRVTVELEVLMNTRQYLHFLQELPEIFSFNEFHNLRSRLTWKQNHVHYLEEPLPVEVKLVEDRKYRPWLITFTVFIIFCFIGIISLFFTIPNLYKQDIHFLRSDTVHQDISISNSRIDLDHVSFTNKGVKDTLIVKDKKIIIAK